MSVIIASSENKLKGKGDSENKMRNHDDFVSGIIASSELNFKAKGNSKLRAHTALEPQEHR